MSRKQKPTNKHDLTVPDLQRAKRECEASMAHALNQLTLKTGVSVEKVGLSPVEQAGSRSYLVSVKLEL